MRSDPIEVEVWPARWPIGAPHNSQRYGPQRFRDCGEVRSKDWTVWPEPGAQPVRAKFDAIADHGAHFLAIGNPCRILPVFRCQEARAFSSISSE
jgi:hypothetical protein